MCGYLIYETKVFYFLAHFIAVPVLIVVFTLSLRGKLARDTTDVRLVYDTIYQDVFKILWLSLPLDVYISFLVAVECLY